MRMNLKLLRVRHNLTQGEMAKRIGINSVTYSLIESGKRQGKPETWQSIQDEFNIPDSEMFALMKDEEREVPE